MCGRINTGKCSLSAEPADTYIGGTHGSRAGSMGSIITGNVRQQFKLDGDSWTLGTE